MDAQPSSSIPACVACHAHKGSCASEAGQLARASTSQRNGGTGCFFYGLVLSLCSTGKASPCGLSCSSSRCCSTSSSLSSSPTKVFIGCVGSRRGSLSLFGHRATTAGDSAAGATCTGRSCCGTRLDAVQKTSGQAHKLRRGAAGPNTARSAPLQARSNALRLLLPSFATLFPLRGAANCP